MDGKKRKKGTSDSASISNRRKAKPCVVCALGDKGTPDQRIGEEGKVSRAPSGRARKKREGDLHALDSRREQNRKLSTPGEQGGGEKEKKGKSGCSISQRAQENQRKQKRDTPRLSTSLWGKKREEGMWSFPAKGEERRGQGKANGGRFLIGKQNGWEKEGSKR